MERPRGAAAALAFARNLLIRKDKAVGSCGGRGVAKNKLYFTLQKAFILFRICNLL